LQSDTLYWYRMGPLQRFTETIYNFVSFLLRF